MGETRGRNVGDSVRVRANLLTKGIRESEMNLLRRARPKKRVSTTLTKKRNIFPLRTGAESVGLS